MEYSYRFFHEDRNPRQEVAREEYDAMRRNLNYFMHKMLDQLYGDEALLGKQVRFRTGKLILFLLLTAAGVAGMLWFPHPAGQGFAGFVTVVMGMAILAVPITFWTDRSRFRRQKHEFIQQVKSFYMYQHSLLHKADGYDSYVAAVPEAPLNTYEKYLRKYLH